MKHHRMHTRLLAASLLAAAAFWATSPLSAFPMRGDRGNNAFGQGPHFAGHHKERGPHQMGRMGRPMDPGLRLLQMGNRIGLTDQQEVEILERSQDFRAEMENHMEKGRAIHEELQLLRDRETFDESALRDLLKELAPIRTEGVILRAKYRHELGQLLTEEQREKIESPREQWRRNRGEGFRKFRRTSGG